jgi:hypothetical protein
MIEEDESIFELTSVSDPRRVGKPQVEGESERTSVKGSREDIKSLLFKMRIKRKNCLDF